MTTSMGLRSDRADHPIRTRRALDVAAALSQAFRLRSAAWLACRGCPGLPSRNIVNARAGRGPAKLREQHGSHGRGGGEPGSADHA